MASTFVRATFMFDIKKIKNCWVIFRNFTAGLDFTKFPQPHKDLSWNEPDFGRCQFHPGKKYFIFIFFEITSIRTFLPVSVCYELKRDRKRIQNCSRFALSMLKIFTRYKSAFLLDSSRLSDDSLYSADKSLVDPSMSLLTSIYQKFVKI